MVARLKPKGINGSAALESVAVLGDAIGLRSGVVGPGTLMIRAKQPVTFFGLSHSF